MKKITILQTFFLSMPAILFGGSDVYQERSTLLKEYQTQLEEKHQAVMQASEIANTLKNLKLPYNDEARNTIYGKLTGRQKQLLDQNLGQERKKNNSSEMSHTKLQEHLNSQAPENQNVKDIARLFVGEKEPKPFTTLEAFNNFFHQEIVYPRLDQLIENATLASNDYDSTQNKSGMFKDIFQPFSIPLNLDSYEETMNAVNAAQKALDRAIAKNVDLKTIADTYKTLVNAFSFTGAPITAIQAIRTADDAAITNAYKKTRDWILNNKMQAKEQLNQLELSALNFFHGESGQYESSKEITNIITQMLKQFSDKPKITNALREMQNKITALKDFQSIPGWDTAKEKQQTIDNLNSLYARYLEELQELFSDAFITELQQAYLVLDIQETKEQKPLDFEEEDSEDDEYNGYSEGSKNEQSDEENISEDIELNSELAEELPADDPISSKEQAVKETSLLSAWNIFKRYPIITSASIFATGTAAIAAYFGYKYLTKSEKK